MKLEELATVCKPTWCPGCGNFGLWGAFKNAAVLKNWDNTNTCLIAGIGCHGHILNFTKITSVEGLHGRAIPVATGIKLANNKLNVFVFTGDGDCLAEGGNHFIHTCRRNHNITIIIHDNALFSLTTGQTCPTTPLGEKTKSTPFGNLDNPLNPVALAIASGATFVARAFSSDIPSLQEIIVAANEHQGLSVIDVLQPCTTLNKDYTNQYFQANCYKLDSSYNPSDKVEAFKKSLEWACRPARQGEKQIPLGIIYQEEKPSYESQIPHIKEKSLIEIPLDRNLEELFKKYG